MTIPNLPRILTIEEVAEYLKTKRSVVQKEMEEGRLRGFTIGTEWRCTDVNLLEYLNKSQTMSLGIRADNPKIEFPITDFIEIGTFEYQWPKDKEEFDSGFETTRNINDHSRIFRIGFTNREAAGQKRRRVVVFIDNIPTVEFAAGNNFESDGLLASVIKTGNNKQLRPLGKIPEEYRDFHIARYDSVVQGPYASRNMAIVVAKTDFESMIRHAIIRATLKERI